MEELVLRHEKELADARMSSGNAAAMREALVAIRDAARNFCHQILNSKYNFIMDKYKCRERGFPALLDLRYAIPKANFAIAAPPRNCDVGTAEEQIKRWEKFCMEHHEYWKPSKSMAAIQRCNCPCREGNGCNYFIWAQMPYEEGGAK